MRVGTLLDGVWSGDSSPRSVLVLPDGCVDVAEIEGRLKVIGPMSRARQATLRDPSARGLRFRPARVRSWLGVSPKELLDTVVDAAEFSSLRGVSDLAHVLQLAQQQVTDVGLLAGVAVLERGCGPESESGRNPVRRAAAAVGLGSRQFRRRFVDEVGLTPRYFVRIRRLQRLVPLLQGDAVSLRDAALDAGYADQAHMSREVRALVGASPSSLVRSMSETFKTPANNAS